MDISEKCRFKLNMDHRLLEFRMKGFWTEEEAEATGVLFRHNVDEVSENGKNRFKVLIDARDFPAQSDSVRAIILKSMTHSLNNGLEKSARIVGKAITVLQFRSMAKDVAEDKEHSVAQFGEFYTRTEALKWLGLPDSPAPF